MNHNYLREPFNEPEIMEKITEKAEKSWRFNLFLLWKENPSLCDLMNKGCITSETSKDVFYIINNLGVYIRKSNCEPF